MAPVVPAHKKTDANIEKVGEIVPQNRRLSIRAVAELTLAMKLVDFT